jgi:hypothetical protein
VGRRRHVARLGGQHVADDDRVRAGLDRRGQDAATSGDLRAMHTSSISGSAETDASALTVSPSLPPTPSVVTTLTPVTAARIASTKRGARARTVMRAVHPRGANDR